MWDVMQSLGIKCHNCSAGHSGDVAENCLRWVNSSRHLVTRSVRRSVLLMVKETHKKETHSGEQLGFSLHRGKKKLSFFLYSLKLGSVMPPVLFLSQDCFGY